MVSVTLRPGASFHFHQPGALAGATWAVGQATTSGAAFAPGTGALPQLSGGRGIGRLLRRGCNLGAVVDSSGAPVAAQGAPPPLALAPSPHGIGPAAPVARPDPWVSAAGSPFAAPYSQQHAAAASEACPPDW
eukprot:875652-Alexandrium_andersonii.AAC.1